MNLLMISGDKDLIKGNKGPFYYLLREFSKYWNRIDVICPVRGKNNLFFDNVHLHGVKNSTHQIYKKAKEIYKHNEFDVVTAHDYPPFRHSKAAKKIYKKYGTPYMIEIHHIVGYPKAADFKEWLLKIYFELFFRRVAKKAKAIRVVNQNQTPTFLLLSGIKKSKMAYIPSFYIDKNVFKPQEKNKMYDLLFVGRLVKNKGLELLMEIKQKLPDLKMAIVGDGPMNCILRSKIEDLGLSGNVTFLGWLPDARALAKVYFQSKVLLITSANEGGPRVGLEALACGTPVISTEVGIMSDVIKNGQNGYIVDWEVSEFVDRIKAILEAPDMSDKAVESVKKFDYETMIKDYAQGIKKIIN